MRKIFIVLSVASLLCLSVVPSQALIGMPDAVPGTHLIQPFFLVPIPGTDGTDNTLMALTEVKGFDEKGQNLHWYIMDRTSVERANGKEPYTKYDVVVLNAQELVLDNCSVDALKALEVDLDEDGVNEYYMGYIVYENSNAQIVAPCCDDACEPHDNVGQGADNFIGHMYVVDIPTGRASGSIIPAREWAPRSPCDPLDDSQYWPMQNACLNSLYVPPVGELPFPNFTDYEVFTAAALSWSKFREHDDRDADWLMPTWFRLLPRYYLKNGTGETFFFIWSSGNWGKFFDDGMFNPDLYNVVINIYDEDETVRSGYINIPYELNFINVRNTIPSSWLGVALGGWFDIRWDLTCLSTWDPAEDFPWIYDAIPLAAEWLGYSYQYAFDTAAALNWNVLFPMHRDVDTLHHMEWICGEMPDG